MKQPDTVASLCPSHVSPSVWLIAGFFVWRQKSMSQRKSYIGLYRRINSSLALSFHFIPDLLTVRKKLQCLYPSDISLKLQVNQGKKKKKRSSAHIIGWLFFLLLTCCLGFKCINAFDSLEVTHTHVFLHHRGVICVWATTTDGHPCISPHVRATWIWCSTYWLTERQSMLKIVMGTHPCATLYASGKTQTVMGWCLFSSAF